MAAPESPGDTSRPPSHTEIERELRRVADRLRTLPESALSAGRADAAHRTAELLVALTAELAGEEPPPLPRLSPFAAGDQITVVGHELLAALAGHSAGEPVAVRALAVLRELRARL